jgi:hypothetical protein
MPLASRPARTPGPLLETGRACGPWRARRGVLEARILHVRCPSTSWASYVQELPSPPASCVPSTLTARDYLLCSRGMFAFRVPGRSCPAREMHPPRAPPGECSSRREPDVPWRPGSSCRASSIDRAHRESQSHPDAEGFASRVANRRSEPPSTHASLTRMWDSRERIGGRALVGMSANGGWSAG